MNHWHRIPWLCYCSLNNCSIFTMFSKKINTSLLLILYIIFAKITWEKFYSGFIQLFSFLTGDNGELPKKQFSSVQSLSHVWLFVTQWTTAHQASLSIISSQSLLKLMSIELAMTSNHLILWGPLLLLLSIFPRIRVFSNESVLWIMWANYWSFRFSISPSNEYSGLVQHKSMICKCSLQCNPQYFIHRFSQFTQW